ncbi:potassium/proton antiporter [Candidatus Viridilinea mediisalina]|uniref:K+/H+ antiporter n=1 Tax=Candidatus Viridilinea mediisalina TaxID=2024553 RepID=A0A2A6RJ27_9CHLR|nr:potassium/proton antiporter [Candidatus Viridilinea mediisalina]PDW02896.1 K+/H+ antiporter [Candidatus Viridilinea mediisalina]
MSVELLLLITGLLLGVSIVATRTSSRFGVPALLLFLTIGMLAGSEGPGGLEFGDYQLAQTVGVVALIFILFSGGLDTTWSAIRPVFAQGMLLANVGVLLSAMLLGGFAILLFGFDWKTGLLLGAIVSSTDAAAVFSVMRERGVNLKHNLEPLIELESGSNDPIAVFLTLGLVGLILTPASSLIDLVPSFILQMTLGAGGGWLCGFLMVMAINRIRLQQEGLYVVFSLALTLLCYGLVALLGGNGFLAVYLAGIIVGNRNIVHKRTILRFHDGVAWLMQITMFLSLGLLVFPSALIPVAPQGLLVALFLIFIARPISVAAVLIWFRRSLRELLMVSWAGLRGAVPIVLATFPLIAGVPDAIMIFNVIFFVVLVSVLLQGMSINWVAKWLGVNAERAEPSESQVYIPDVKLSSRMVEAIIPADSPFVDRSLIDIGLPRGVLVVQIQRGETPILPSGGTVLRADDHLLVLATPETIPILKQIYSNAKVRLVNAGALRQEV